VAKLRDLHGNWARGSTDRRAHGALEDEAALAQAIAEARARAGLTQAEVAERMHTTQSNVARMEAGRTTPSTRTLEKFAQAVGAKLKITFEPVRQQ